MSGRNVVAAPIKSVSGVIVLGRDGPPFSSSDVHALRDTARRESGDLKDALELRKLARRLARFGEDKNAEINLNRERVWTSNLSQYRRRMDD